MIKTVLIVLSICLVVAVELDAQARPSSTSASQWDYAIDKNMKASDQVKARAVLQREAEKIDAYMKLDPAAAGKFFAPDYIQVSSRNGCCNHVREEALKSVIDHRDAADPHPIRSYTLESLKVRIYGNTAIVSGAETINIEYTKHSPPEKLSVRLVFTDIWQLRGRQWMLILSQRSPF